MALIFPSNPQVNDTYTSSGITWIWDGTVWNIQPLTITLIGDVIGSGSTSINTSLNIIVPIEKGGTGLSTLGTAGQILRVNSGGTGLEYYNPALGSISSINGLTDNVQTFAVGTSGLDFDISSSGGVHTFNIPTASAINRGLLSASDFATFSSKQSAITLTVNNSSGPASFAANTLNIPTYTLTGLGGFANPMVAVGDLIYGDTSGAATRLAMGTASQLLRVNTAGTGLEYFTPSYLTASGTADRVVKFTGTGTTIGDSLITDDGTNVGINTSPISTSRLDVNGVIRARNIPASTDTTEEFGTNGKILVAGGLSRGSGGEIYYRTPAQLVSDMGLGTLSNVVTLDTAQTISGLKTFSAVIQSDVGIEFQDAQSIKWIGTYGGLAHASIQFLNNTGMLFKAAGGGGATSLFLEDTTDRRVGVGTESPVAKLHSTIASSGSALMLQNSAGGTGVYVDLDFVTYSTSQPGYANASASIRVIDDGAYSGHISFRTKGNTVGAAQTEKFRIASDGAATFSDSVTANGFYANAGNSARFYRGANDYYWRIHSDSSNFLNFGAYLANGTDYGTNPKVVFHDNGSVGIGVTPSAWEVGRKALQIGAALALDCNNNTQAILSANRYFDGTNDKRINTGESTAYQQLTGQHIFYTAASNSAGTNISFTQAMTLTAAGRLLLGTNTEGTYLLDVNGTGRFINDVTISSTGSAKLKITADTDNVTETDIAAIELSQDGGTSTSYFGINSTNDLIIGVNSTNSPSIYIGTRNDGTSFVAEADAKVTILNDGKVGIGTALPVTLLDIRSTLDSTGYTTAANLSTGANLSLYQILNVNTTTDDNGEAGILLSHTFSNAAQWGISVKRTGSFVGDLIFRTRTGNTTSAERMRIASTGAATFTSSVTASSFIKSGGTSAQFLMADGNVSTNPGWITSYTETDTLATVTGRGNSTANAIDVQNRIYSRAAQTNGDYTTAALWTQSFSSTTTGIAFHISGTVGKFLEMRTNGILYWEGNTVLHAGNYSSYALPLSGGNLTGDLQISSNWGVGGYNEQLIIYGTYPSWTVRSTTSDTGWLFHTEVSGHWTLYSIAGAGTNNWTQRYTFNTDGTFRNGGPSGSVYLHAGNYNSYALPLSGGTLTGDVIFTDLKSSLDNTYGFLGRNVYADTVNGRGSDPLELNYYDGGPVKIGSGTNGSKSLYAVGIYDNGNQVLHAGNFNSYAPQLNGTGASGTWSINITGNSGYASSAGAADSSTYVTTRYDGIVSGNPMQYFGNSIGLRVAMTGAWSVWSDTLWINGYSGGDVKQMVAIHTLRNGQPRMGISAQAHDATSYGTVYEVITGYNIGSQSVSYATSAGSASTATSATSAGSVPASGITGQVGMWTSGNRPGAYRLYRRDDDSAYNVQTYWTGSYWRLYGYFGDTAHADTHVGYADSAGYASSSGQVSINYNNDSNSTYQVLWGSGNSVYGTAGFYVNPASDYVYASSFNASDWFRSTGNTGWYSTTYGGGWYMEDTSWIRSYGGKSIYCTGIIRAQTDFRVGSEWSVWGMHNGQSAYMTRLAYISFNWTDSGTAYNSPSNHGIMSTDVEGNYSDGMSINSYNDITLRLDTNGNNSDSYLRISKNVTGSNGVFAYTGYNGSAYLSYFTGTLYNTGDVIAYYSDARLKTDIRKIDSALDKLDSINGYYYKPNELALQLNAATDDKQKLGVLAQEIMEVFPEVIEKAPFDIDEKGNSKSGQDYMTVKYERLVPVLIQAIKELKQEINTLKNK